MSMFEIHSQPPVGQRPAAYAWHEILKAIRSV